MQFDMDKLNTALTKMTRRTKSIPVENEILKKFFKEDPPEQKKEAPKRKTKKKAVDPKQDPVQGPAFLIQNLTALEMALAKNQVDNHSQREKILEGILGNIPSEDLKAIKKLAGVITFDANGEPDDLPEDYIRRIFYAVHGCLVPKFSDQQQVIKFSRAFPVEFFSLTNEIILLTGMGMDLGES